MTESDGGAKQTPIRFERRFEGRVEDLWDLWTTKEGFESWWGPEGFRTEVHEIDPRVGGTLFYEMIADTPETIAHMRDSGMALSHETRGTFTEVDPPRRITIRHAIDFIPGIEPYEHHMSVEFFPEGDEVRMVMTMDPHITPEWTERAQEGFGSQLKKLPAALAARRGTR